MKVKDTLGMYSKRILLVDDVELFLAIARDFFRREQVQVLTATSGPEALAVIRESRPSLVFMDLYMPGGDGDAACREVKADHHLGSTPVIMVTSSDNPRDIDRCREAGCDDVVQKPLTRDHFLRLSRRHVRFPAWSGQRVRTELPLRFRHGPEGDKDGTAIDISVGGFFLATSDPLPVGTQLAFACRLAAGAAPVRAEGRVAWVNGRTSPRKPAYPPGMGVEFVVIKNLDLLTIQGLVTRTSRGLEAVPHPDPA